MKDVMTSRQGNPLHFVPSMRHQVSSHGTVISVVGHLTYIVHIMRWLWHNRDCDWTIVQCVLERNLVSRTEHIWEKMECTYTNTHFSTTEQSTKKQYLWKSTFRKERVEDITTHDRVVRSSSSFDSSDIILVVY